MRMVVLCFTNGNMMAKAYVKYKSKKFSTKGEANTWAKKEKKAYGPMGVLRIDINRIANPSEGASWEALLMRREG